MKFGQIFIVTDVSSFLDIWNIFGRLIFIVHSDITSTSIYRLNPRKIKAIGTQ